MLDDRAQPVKILRSVFEPWPTKDDARIASLIRRLNVAIRGENRFRRAIVIVPTAVIGFVLFFGSLGLMRLLPGIPVWIGPIAAVIALNAVVYLVSRNAVNWSAERVASIILKEGLCPSCGYNFHGLDLAPDGKCVCPECGAAWNPQRIWRTAPFEPKAPTGSPVRAITHPNRQPAWTTRDATRMSVELAPAGLRAVLKTATPARAPRLKDAWAEAARRSRWMRWPVLGLMWGGSATLVATLLLNENADWIGTLVTAIFLTVICTLATLANFLYSPRAMRRAMLARAFCPSCTSDLLPMRSTPERHFCTGCLTEWDTRHVATNHSRSAGEVPSPAPSGGGADHVA